jgi:hypothetical protein
MNLIFIRTIALIMSTVPVISACTKEAPALPLTNCSISPQFSECTPVPTLQTGQLILMPSKEFVLKAQYGACYHQENVTIQGRYKNSIYPDSLLIELLATHIEGLDPSTFPSTVAVVTLDRSSQQGIVTDIWATIRSPIKSNNRYVSEITCTPD